jgi:hypothetical protein
MRLLNVLVIVLLASACSAHRTRIDCDTRLTPINAPAPATSAPVAGEPGKSPGEAPR